MAITTLQECLDFIGISQEYFTVNSSSDIIVMKYNGGSSTNVELVDGTYTGDALATELKTRIDAAFTITSTVTWNSTTRKYTIAVTTGNTIQVISSGSDAALLLGFSQNSSAAVSIASDTTVQSDPTAVVTTIKNGVEAYVKKYCNRNLEASTSYVNRRFNGTGTKQLVLDHFPIVSLTKLAIGTQDVLRIKNTNVHTVASVSVLTTGLSLERNGTADSTITWASNTTLSAVVTAVNLLSGWSATIQSSDYNSYISTELIPEYGLNAIDSNDVYLKVTDDANDDFSVDYDRGIIYLPYDFPVGNRNIYVSYVAYSVISDDLKLAILMLVKFWYQKRQEETFGLSNYGIGDIRATFTNLMMPIECKIILDKYRRILI